MSGGPPRIGQGNLADKATYTLSPGRNDAREEPAAPGIGVPGRLPPSHAPWLQACVVVVTAWLWLLTAQVFFDIVLKTNLAGTDDGRPVIFLRVLPLTLAAFLVLRHSFARRARAECRLDSLVSAMPQLCAMFDREGMVEYAHPDFLRKLSSSGALRSNACFETLLAPALLSPPDGALLPERGEIRVDVRLKGDDGVMRPCAVRIRRISHPHADLGWIVIAAGDADTAALRADHALKSQVLDTAVDAIAIAEIGAADMPLIYVNPAFEALTGYQVQDVLGRNLRFLQGSDRMQPEIAVMRDCIAKRRPAAVTLRNYHRDGTMFWNQVRLSLAYDGGGQPSHYIATMQDVTEFKQNAHALAQLTHFDQATGLFNRAYFTDALAGLLTHRDAKVLVVAVDVKRLDNLIQCFGEATGNALLKAIATRLRALPGTVRAQPMLTGTLTGTLAGTLTGRLGDNAFGVAIALTDGIAAEPAVDTIRTALQDPFRLPDGDLALQFSVGMAIGEAGMAAASVMHRALAAASHAHHADPGAATIFETISDDDIRRRVGLSRDLDHAVASGAFALHLQPTMALADGGWVGAEALVRWRHPIFGLQSPALFLSVSEETGQILKIDAWALRNAASLVQRLYQECHVPLAVSVNLSSLRLQRHDLVAMLDEILHATGASPGMLKLEIAERVMAASDDDIIGDLAQLRARGFGIVVDNFGAGRERLLNLNTLPLTGIKIDRSIIRGCDSSAYRQTVIGSIVTIGQALGVEVTATGVESDAQKQMLERLGVQQAQGFLFGAPVDAAAFIALAHERSRHPAKPTAACRQGVSMSGRP